MMDKEFLLLWLEAPLQSWGADSKFGRRDSLAFPTKSGILGLLCAALGASGEQRELLAEMAPLEQTVVSYVRFRQKEKATVKADTPLLLRDFHMVGSGYNTSDPWENLLIPKTADGKTAVGGGTKMTYRYYLQDAQFAAIVKVPAKKAEHFADALQNPVYDIYLGRKNCVPTDFVFRGLFTDTESALAAAEAIAADKNVTEDFRVVSGDAEGDPLVITDVPLQFGQIKKYQDRRVTIIHHE
jgi:CRISPR system Cascade subunit CasD